MKNLLAVTVTTLLIVSSSASAGRYDYDGGNNWNNSSRNNSYHDGRHDGSADASGDWDSNIQFDVQMRGDGDAEGYVYGNLGEGWDDIEIHRYDNDSMRSAYIKNQRIRNHRVRNDRLDYRDARRPYDNQGQYYGPYRRPYYEPGYYERYRQPQH